MILEEETMKYDCKIEYLCLSKPVTWMYFLHVLYGGHSQQIAFINTTDILLSWTDDSVFQTAGWNTWNVCCCTYREEPANNFPLILQFPSALC